MGDALRGRFRPNLRVVPVEKYLENVEKYGKWSVAVDSPWC